MPTSCPADCAAAFSAWQTACADQAAATVTEADTALGGGVWYAVARKNLAAKRAEAAGDAEAGKK